jgi:putative nucleotidyltransferase with HDIG domain
LQRFFEQSRRFSGAFQAPRSTGNLLATYVLHVSLLPSSSCRVAPFSKLGLNQEETFTELPLMTAHELVAKARNLPQVSGAALKLVNLLDEADDSKEAIDVIKSDALLTAKLLRLCNSSTMALAEPVSSVDHAILLLGHNQVLNLVLSLAFGKTMTCPLPGYAMEANDLWRHAFLTATAGEAIVNRGFYSGVEPSVAFTAGLLHDMGKLVMAQAMTGEAYSTFQKHLANSGAHGVTAEREVTGTDHAEVGACLLHVWRLPDLIIEAVANHHKPVLKPEPHLSALTHVADRVAHLADAKSAVQNLELRDEEEVVQALDLTQEDRAELIQLVAQSSERSQALMALA